jgi:hypothetical protein
MQIMRGIAQFGRALGSGPRGRKFKSCYPDQIINNFSNFKNHKIKYNNDYLNMI